MYQSKRHVCAGSVQPKCRSLGPVAELTQPRSLRCPRKHMARQAIDPVKSPQRNWPILRALQPRLLARLSAVSRFLDAATASVYGAVLRPNPASREIATAWARLTAPSLLMMLETWLRTVFSEIFSRTD